MGLALFSLCALQTLIGAPAATPARATVVVLPFVSLSAAEYAPITHGVPLVINGLLLDKDLNVIATSEVSRYLRKSDLTPDKLNTPLLNRALARNLGADWIISGTFQARWPDIYVSLRILDGKDGSVRAEASELAPLDGVLALLSTLADRVLVAAGLGKVKRDPSGTDSVTAFRNAALAAELLSVQPMTPQLRNVVPMGSLRTALLHAENAIKADPKWPVPHAYVALALALTAVVSGDGATVPRILEEGEKGSAGAAVAEAAYAIYIAGVINRRLPEAQAGLERAMTKTPGALAIANLAGEARQFRQAHREAKTLYEALVLRAPNNPRLLMRLGKSLVELGEADAGLARTQNAVALSDESPELLVELGSRLIDLKKLPEAEATLKRALEKDKREGRAYLRLGHIYLLRNEPTQAITILERAIAASDLEEEWRSRAWAHFNLARAHSRMGAIDRAFRELELAIENGFNEGERIQGQEDFTNLVKDKRWGTLLGKLPPPAP